MRNGHNAPELDIPGRLAAWTILVFGAELRDFPRGAGAGELPPCTPPPVSHVDCLALCVKAHSSLHMGTPLHAAARASGTRIASQSLINRDGGVNRSSDRLRIYTMGGSSRNVQNSISSGLQRRYTDRDTGIDHIQRDARPSKTQRRETTHLLQMPAPGATTSWFKPGFPPRTRPYPRAVPSPDAWSSYWPTS